MTQRLGSFSFDVISRILGILSSGEEMRITNLAIETRMSYYGCMRYVSLLETIGWIERTRIKEQMHIRGKSEFSHSSISISTSGLEILGRIAPLASKSFRTPRLIPPAGLVPPRLMRQNLEMQQVMAGSRDQPSIPKERDGLRKPLRLLLVDDEEDVLFTYEAVLKSRGHRVEAFSDPATALSNFIQKGSGSFDIVLLDIRMPKINGIQLFRSVRAIDSEVKIVFLTSLDLSPELSSVTEQLGANHLIRKPVTNEEFLKEIEACV